MTPHDHLRRSLAAAKYLEAWEHADEPVIQSLWAQAATDPELLRALREIHAGLLEEAGVQEGATVRATVAEAVKRLLPSATVVEPSTGAVTVADVAEELVRQTPDRLPAAAHGLNDRLRSAREPVPTDLGLTRLTAWAEAHYGSAPPEYWRAFYAALVKLDLQRASEREYRLAARRVPKPGGGT